MKVVACNISGSSDVHTVGARNVARYQNGVVKRWTGAVGYVGEGSVLQWGIPPPFLHYKQFKVYWRLIMERKVKCRKSNKVLHSKDREIIG
ncbi:hypothetical protein PR048_005694 [Dryococelus australis]|uniref:Uncharacterized protein n=1 Tax=Dryococelus australis TaxID=614101 RepID=A0ABQ9I8Z1_9NEOP|nr:hypothetical protein PR048_005694 [Dryococelus australis]